MVGINTAIVSRTGGNQGIGFAIPSNMAVQVKDALLKHGKVMRGWLGIAIQDLTAELGKSLGIARSSGVLVSDVTPDSPAANAGLRRGDVITAIDDQPMHDSAHLRNLVALAGKGKSVRIEFLRDGKARTVQITLGEAPNEGGAGSAGPTSAAAGPFSGVNVQELDAAIRQRLRIPPRVQGVVVASVDPHSDGAGTGLRPGDVIVELNRVETPNVEAFRKDAAEQRNPMLVLVYRDGATLYLSISR